MKLKSLITAGLLVSMVSAPTIAATSLNTQQKKEVEQIIHDYLIQNPEILVEVSQALQKKQQQTMQEQAKGAISKNANQLFNEKLTVAGNPEGNVTLVEFFDYQCIHCKKMKPIINELMKENKNLRVIYKEFPIFGKNSEIASKAAIAAAMQGKYLEMQSALLSKDKRLDEKAVMDAAKSAGLDMAKLKKDMDSKTVKEELEANRKLAENMNLMGTPAFVVASTPKGKFDEKSDPAFIPGAATKNSLENLINQVAKNNENS